MKKFFIVFVFLLSHLSAISVEKNLDTMHVLSGSKLWIAAVDTTLQDAKQSSDFKNYIKNHINLGFNSSVAVWVKLNLLNSQDIALKKVLSVDNPLCEEVVFFDQSNDFVPHLTGMLHVTAEQTWIDPSYIFTLEPNEKRTLYIKVKNANTDLQFGVILQDYDTFVAKDKTKQFLIVFCIGLLSAFLIYALILYVYTKNISYLLYVFYLITLMYQQLTYIGFLPLYATSFFTSIDAVIVVPKVSIMIIAAALFAKKFLRADKFPILEKIYQSFIVVVLLHIPIVGTTWFYLPEVTLVLGFLFVLFNTFSGIFIYKHGYKQARFFIVGWSFLIVGYVLMIFDSLGFISIMHHFPELILWITVFEALFLLLAFVDKINILDKKLFDEMSNRQMIVENEVTQRTNALHVALSDKVVLLRELHHRVKNNLQLILSIIRLQRYEIKNKTNINEFKKLEMRIRAISKTHEILCFNDDIDEVNMQEYIGELCEEIQSAMADHNNLKIHLESTVTMNLSQAVYVGLILNELISNSIKHAFGDDGAEVFISLVKAHNDYILNVYDTGNGYTDKEVNGNSLGLKLVRTLALEQLDGKIERGIRTSEYTIVFSSNGDKE